MTGSRDRQLVEDVRDRVGLVALVGRDVGLKRRGRAHWGLCPFHSERTPSFTVSEERGTWRCYGCGRSGDCFGWVMERRGTGFRDALRELAEAVGLASPSDGPARPVMPPVAGRKSAAELAAEDQQAIARARATWARGRPIGGSPAAAYLAARAIRLQPLPPTLRFVSPLRYAFEDRTGALQVHGAYPAMLAAIQDGAGRITGVHRTYLDPDRAAKASDLPVVEGKRLGAKKMTGRAWGGAIRLAAAAPVMGLAEGIETALSVMQATGLPMWAAGSMGNLAACALPAEVREVRIFADGDSDPDATERVLQHAARAHGGAGRRVRVVRPPAGRDFNDILMEAAHGG